MKFITLTLVRRLPNMSGSKKNFHLYLACSLVTMENNRNLSSIHH